MPSRKYSKKDNNHDALVGALSKMVPVLDTYQYGGKLMDGLARINGGGWHFFDVKNPDTAYGRKGLNDSQRKHALKLGSPVYLLYTMDDVINFASGKFDALKRFPDDKVSAADLT
ncbi:hypothetical protein [uncultured Pelagimonas sp.]|uniref:hypothetical protein n=1 Tax=uncultured Pelagimonas sp. TaxID=1618102 RepID=UPI00260D1C3C|nr:hypothetical protein [uncultured Pelagimonas sp.]